MITVDFKDKKLTLLGMGTMRFPLIEGSTNPKDIDFVKTEELIDTAISLGVNYFDTAYPYHASRSEVILGEILSKYPRDSYFLATKFPGHQILSSYDPERVFEEQLKKCKVDYFDFYLLHNIYENSIETYKDSRWGIIDYFLEQKKIGRIKHLGFSTHGSADFLDSFLSEYGRIMEFCQIQMNYLDWTLQDAKKKYEILEKHNIPVWVMEPIRGGKLADLPEECLCKLKALRPEWSCSEWSFRWLQGFDNIKMILSGMSDMDQLLENAKTFQEHSFLSEEEAEALNEVSHALKNGVPCTGCGYCMEGCPQGINIPDMMSSHNDICYVPSFNIGMRMDAVPIGKRACDCIGCNNCSAICPQKIDIPLVLKDFAERLEKLPKWADICREREIAAKQLND